MKIATKLFFILMVLLISGAIIVGNTRPIDDGDTFWQMVYGKYMLDNHTLIPDHTAFSWTPTRSDALYCAWISEISLYLIYNAFGFIGLFMLRYTTIIISVGMFIWFAQKRRTLLHPLVAFSMLVAVVAYSQSSASAIKPEMYSFLFMVILVFLWWHIRHTKGQRIGEIYLFPVIMTIWVNSHGGFLIAYPFLIIIVVGEFINGLLKSDGTLPVKARKHLLYSVILSCFAVFITPYGFQYPYVLLTQTLQSGRYLEQVRTVRAYQATMEIPFFVLYFFFMLFIFTYTLILTIRKKCIDATFIFSNVAYALLYLLYSRLVFFWVPVLVFSVIYTLQYDRLYKLAEKRPIIKIALSIIVILFSINHLYFFTQETLLTPYRSSWAGFGINYTNAPEEAAFIEQYLLKYRIGNVYDIGGYLMWRIWPRSKVMIDPRYFPYQNMYDKYYSFAMGKNVQSFLRKYPCDVMAVQYDTQKLYQELLYSPEWKIAFYGTGGIVFIRKELPYPMGKSHHGSGIYECNNMIQAANIIQFALVKGDFKVAKRLIDSMKKNFGSFNMYKTILYDVENLHHAYALYYSHEFDKSMKILMELCKNEIYRPSNEYLSTLYHFKTLELWHDGKYNNALEYTNKALKINNLDPYGIYNSGIIQWYSMHGMDTKKIKSDYFLTNTYKQYMTDAQWREPLSYFVNVTKGMQGAAIPRTIAENILSGQYHQKPVLIAPTFPPLIDIMQSK